MPSETFLFIEADYKEKELRIWIKGSEILEAWKFFRKDFIDLSQKFEYDELVEVENERGAMMSYKELINLSKQLKKDQLDNWYNPNLNIKVNVLKTLALFDDKLTLFKELEQNVVPKIKKADGEFEIEVEQKKLEFERIKLKQNQEAIVTNLMIARWRRQSLLALVISLVVTILVFAVFRGSEYLKWISVIIGFVWNGFVGKMLYDRHFDHSKEKAFRDSIKNNVKYLKAVDELVK